MMNLKKQKKHFVHAVLFTSLFFYGLCSAAESHALSQKRARNYFKKGNACFNGKKYQKAISYYKKALRANPLFADAAYNIGASYHYLGGEWESHAINWYQKAIQLNPEISYAYHNLGVLAYNRGDYGEALSYFTKALELSPDDEETKENLEMVKDALLDELESAMEDEDEAIV